MLATYVGHRPLLLLPRRLILRWQRLNQPEAGVPKWRLIRALPKEAKEALHFESAVTPVVMQGLHVPIRSLHLNQRAMASRLPTLDVRCQVRAGNARSSL